MCSGNKILTLFSIFIYLRNQIEWCPSAWYFEEEQNADTMMFFFIDHFYLSLAYTYLHRNKEKCFYTSKEIDWEQVQAENFQFVAHF